VSSDEVRVEVALGDGGDEVVACVLEGSDGALAGDVGLGHDHLDHDGIGLVLDGGLGAGRDGHLGLLLRFLLLLLGVFLSVNASVEVHHDPETLTEIFVFLDLLVQFVSSAGHDVRHNPHISPATEVSLGSNFETCSIRRSDVEQLLISDKLGSVELLVSDFAEESRELHIIKLRAVQLIEVLQRVKLFIIRVELFRTHRGTYRGRENGACGEIRNSA